MRLFSDTEIVLQFFADGGIRLALITNGESATQRHKIDRFCLDRYFSEIFIEGEQDVGKPDSRIFEMALSATGVPRDRTCMRVAPTESSLSGMIRPTATMKVPSRGSSPLRAPTIIRASFGTTRHAAQFFWTVMEITTPNSGE